MYTSSTISRIYFNGIICSIIQIYVSLSLHRNTREQISTILRKIFLRELRACFLYRHLRNTPCVLSQMQHIDLTQSRRLRTTLTLTVSRSSEERIKPVSARVYDRVADRLTFTSHRWGFGNVEFIELLLLEFYVSPFDAFHLGRMTTFARPCIGGAFRLESFCAPVTNHMYMTDIL